MNKWIYLILCTIFAGCGESSNESNKSKSASTSETPSRSFPEEISYRAGLDSLDCGEIKPLDYDNIEPTVTECVTNSFAATKAFQAIYSRFSVFGDLYYGISYNKQTVTIVVRLLPVCDQNDICDYDYNVIECLNPVVTSDEMAGYYPFECSDHIYIN